MHGLKLRLRSLARVAAARWVVWTLFAAAFAPTGAAVAQIEPWDAARLMQLLAHTPHGHTRFVEKKYLRILKTPLESSGELFFVAPARLEKRTLLPKPETLVLDNDTLTIERNQKKRSISVQSYPEVGALVGSIRAALAGDLQQLQRSFRLELSGDPAHWQLALLPSDQGVAALISNMVLSGSRGRIESIEVLQANGDRSITTVTPLAD